MANVRKVRGEAAQSVLQTAKTKAPASAFVRHCSAYFAKRGYLTAAQIFSLAHRDHRPGTQHFGDSVALDLTFELPLTALPASYRPVTDAGFKL